MGWIKDAKAESFMKRIGVEFQYESGILTSDLVADWKKRNLGRPITPLLQDEITKIGVAMLDEEDVPCLIVCKTPLGYEVIDGFQRLHSLEEIGKTSFAAYVVKCKPRERDQIAFGINCKHGQQPGGQEKIEMAFELVERHRMSDKEAEKTMCIGLGTLESIRKCREVFSLCEAAGVDSSGLEESLNGKCAIITQLLDNDEKLIPAVVRAVIEHKLNSPEVKELVDDVYHCEGLGDKLDVIERISSRPEVTMRVSKKRTPLDVQLLQMLRGVDTFSKQHFNEMEIGSVKVARDLLKIAKRIDGRVRQLCQRVLVGSN